MNALMRMTQKVVPGKWAELDEIDKRFNVLEKRLGFPQNKKRYQCLMGAHDSNTLIIEYQWDSLAALEAVYEKAFADPEYQAILNEVSSIVESNQIEIYTQLP